MAATRLDRLVSLLDSGSTPAIRATAAKQLGQIAAVRIRGQSTAQQAASVHFKSSSAAAGEPPSAASAAAQRHRGDGGLASGTSTPAYDAEADGAKREDLAGAGAANTKYGTSDQRSRQQRFEEPSSADDAGLYRGTEGDWDEIISYLARVIPFLRSKSWDTRVAASLAVESICHAAGIWDPDIEATKPGQSSKTLLDAAAAGDDAAHAHASSSDASAGGGDGDGLLTFDTFSLPKVLAIGTKLLSSAGKEYDIANLGDPSRLAQAKKDVVSKLGLGFGMDMDLGLDVEAELQTGEAANPANGHGTGNGASSATPTVDWRTAATSGKPTGLPPPKFAQGGSTSLPPPKFAGSTAATAANASSSAPSPSPAPSETPTEEIDMSKLSARERNQLKRKRKLEGKSGGAPSAAPDVKTRIVEASESPAPAASSTGVRVKTPSGFPQTPATPANGRGAGATDYINAQPPPTPRSPAGGPGSHPAVTNSLATPTPVNEAAVSPGPAMSGGAGGGSASTSSFNSGAASAFQARPGEWPFRVVVDTLSVDLFSPMWETRHGAALGLRELLKCQGSGGGKVQLASVEDNARSHKAWCDDLAVKLLCVFALDRLGDFVFDQVVAPVRETVSQTLACLMPHMPIVSVVSVHNVLLQMIRQDHVVAAAATAGEGDAGPGGGGGSGFAAKRGSKGYVWEVRHAGLLGLKYEVVVKKDLLFGSREARFDGMVKKEDDDENEDVKAGMGSDAAAAAPPTPVNILDDVLDVAILGLKDEDDDVRAVAAATLLPIVDVVVSQSPGHVIRLLDQVWDCLGDLKDDLSSSIGGVMDLLAKLVEHPAVIEPLKAEDGDRSLSDLIPRLFPFFRHTITSVRLSVLNALKVFLTVPSLPKEWIDERVLRLLLQNLVVEERLPIRRASAEAWSHALAHVSADAARLSALLGPYIPNFFRIIMTPLGSPIDFSLFYDPSTALGGGGGGGSSSTVRHNVDKNILAQDLSLVGVDAVIRGRLGAAEALGAAMANCPRENDEAAFGALLRDYLDSTSALQKCLTAAVIQEWAERASSGERGDLKDQSPLALDVSGRLISLLETPPPPTYAEMTVMLQRIQAECQGLYNAFGRDAKLAKAKIPALPTTVDPLGMLVDAFTIETAKHVAQQGFDSLLVQVGSRAKKAALPLLEDRQRKLIAAIGFYQATKDKQDIQVYASTASAVISLKVLPSKLNPVIRSIMNSVKFEENLDLQTRSARAVARFVAFCTSSAAKSNPSDKIVKNLCAFVCQDTTQVAIFANVRDVHEGILSLGEQAATSSSAAGPAPAGSGRSLGRPKDEPVESEEVRQGKLIRRGAETAIAQLADHFELQLFDVVPMLWECMSAALLRTFATSAADGDAAIAAHDEAGQGVLDACALLRVIVPHLKGRLAARVADLLPALTMAVQSRYAAVRSAAARCFAAVSDCLTQVALRHVVEQVVPLVGDAGSVTSRQGAIELVFHAVQLLDLKILPYVIFLVVPVLGRMSDADEHVRLMATNTFASLVKMVPLEAGLPDPEGFSPELLQRRQEERRFLTQLLDGNKVEAYEVPVKINAQLRKYQRDGVSWMAFLAKYHLHGILCDDMGLGKTLQSITILSSKHHERAERFKATGLPDARHLPSLIVCPPTLTSHWVHEIRQYSTNLRPLLYSGLPADRARLQAQIASHDAVVMSYDVVRNDIAALSQLSWNYCILDEGHVIRSAKTKTTRAVKMIRAHHRLILSGTPIQNNVLELWSLFDFLMPGFLGTEKAFHDKFGKPIIASRDGKLSSREQEAAALALEALHKQVLPFLLRRLKEDVLDDLPPKIIQDIECDLSDVQKQLYDDFSKTEDQDEVEAAFGGGGGGGGGGNPEQKQHVFKALQYMRKLVNHPKLILKDEDPKHAAIKQKLLKGGGNLDDIANAPKLQALKQLLNDCGIGNPSASAEADALSAPESAVSQHRVLIFCQLKQMMDIIETDLFRAVMPSVSYMRLDGSVSTEKRHGIVQTFNADPSIDVLLLTTQVGGLGLTLTGADTVIFVEHDWNPMKDLQAMDRAHRLGQKKVVNVYRLITRNTLEARIMGDLQRFKLNIANSVVTQQNSGLESMETDQILDLFDAPTGKDGSDGAGAGRKGVGADGGRISQKALLENLEAMPETEEAEYAAMSGWRPDQAS
ncbi:related to MOT1 - transcriptional accessory protein [Pseudozyma flocculosa]|uniref:Related to MOT1 - transcriptional accessory protein n=1 Tax=Pseudozyma flocculosa TaxID=84751 RepID=A0A5C3F6T6_9BASI|nr:related to MOT1 - transcriptional accessory protein [Pseudozyma flocculosa]